MTKLKYAKRIQRLKELEGILLELSSQAEDDSEAEYYMKIADKITKKIIKLRGKL